MSATENDPLQRALDGGLRELGLVPAPDTIARLCEYLDLLERWNGAYNLTAVVHRADMVPRHLLDSLSITPHLRGQRVLDVGTGAGLPGIPLALWFPQREFHLLDSNGKKMRFLFEVRRCLGLDNVTLHHCRVEDLHDTTGFDAILSRAFASIADMVCASAHLLAANGCFLAMKAEVSAGELQALPSHYTVARSVPLSVPGLRAGRQLLCIERATPTADGMASA